MCDDISDYRKLRSGEVNVEWVKKMLDIKSSPSSDRDSDETGLTWEDPAELCAAWNEAIASLKSASETISNQLRAYCEEARSSHCSTYDLEPLHQRHRSLGSSKLHSEWNTFTVPGNSTPVCHSAVELPSFLQSTISVHSADHQEEVKVEASVSRGILKVKKRRRYVRQQCDTGSFIPGNQDQVAMQLTSVGEQSTRTRGRRTPEANPDWEYDYHRSSWQTSGVTRSEVEYQNRKNSSPSVPTEDASLIEIRVKSQADIRPHNAEKRPENFQKEHRRRLDKTEADSRYHQLCQDLEEVRQLDYKMRSYLKRLQEDADGSKGVDDKATSVSKVLQGIEEVLKRFLPKEHDGFAALEEKIHTHLKKIRHQIRLVEKYNRAVLEKLSKSDITNKPPPRSPENEIRKRRQSIHCESTRANTGTPTENLQPKNRHSNDQHDRQNTRSTKHSAAASPQNLERESGIIRDPRPPNVEYWINSPTAPAAAVAVSYERWTWSYVRPMNNNSVYEKPIYNCNAERMRCDQWTSTDGHQHKVKRTVKNLSTGSHEENLSHDKRFTDGRQRRPQRNTWDHLSLLDEDYVNANHERPSRRKTLEQGTVTDPHAESGKRTFARKSIGIGCEEERKRVEQGTVTNEQADYEHLKRRVKNRSTGMERNKERMTLEQGTLANQYDDPKVVKRTTRRSTNTDHGERRSRLEQGTLTQCEDEDYQWKPTFTNKSTSLERRESRRRLNQGTCTEEKRTRDKSVPKMNLKRDGWTLTENPKPREKEIQTVTPFSDLSRSPRYKRNISEREMRERTARLRANDTVLLERRRIEEERARRAANILMQKTYANNIRCHRKGAGLNIDIPTDVSVLGDDDSRSLSMSAND